MDMWRHGRYIDLWSLVHLLSGVLLALGFYGLGIGLTTALISSLILLMAWEVFEWALGIIEPTPNVLVDIVIGAGGLGAGVLWHYIYGQPLYAPVFFILLGATVGLSVWGFIDFRLRGYR